MRQRKVPSGTFYRCLSPKPAERLDPGSGGRTWAQPSAARPGSRPSPASPPQVAGAPRGRARIGGPRPAPHLEPQAGPRRGLRVLGACRWLCSLRRRPTGCWAAVSFLLTSSAASRGRSRHYLHKGRAGQARRTPSAGPQRPGPASVPPPAALRRRGVSALAGRGPPSAPIRGPRQHGAGPRPARICTRRCRPAPGLTCAYLVGERLAAPSVPPPPGGRNSSRNSPRPRATSRSDCPEEPSLHNPARSC